MTAFSIGPASTTAVMRSVKRLGWRTKEPSSIIRLDMKRAPELRPMRGWSVTSPGFCQRRSTCDVLLSHGTNSIGFDPQLQR